MSVVTTDANGEILYRARADPESNRPISEAVVEALATVENVEPENLDLRLYDSLDTDALDRLCEVTAERPERLQVVFTIGEYEVSVEDDGRLVVRPRQDTELESQ